MADHLILKGGTWHVRLDVPVDVRIHPDFFMKKVLTKSLKTGNRQLAKTASLSILADWKQQIHAARTAGNSPLWKMEAHALRQEVSASIARAPSDDYREAHELRDTGIVKILLKYGLQDENLKELKSIVKGMGHRSVAINESLIKEFQKYQSDYKVVEKTAFTQASFVRRYSEFITSKGLHIEYDSFDMFLSQLKLSKQSKQTATIACRAFWNFLISKDKRLRNERNPFNDHQIQSPRTEVKNSYVPFSVKEVEAIYAEAVKLGDLALANTIKIGAYTGCRIEEICQLHVSMVTDATFTVVNAKTASGNRTLPIPNQLRPLFTALVDRADDGYLIESSSGNKFGKRSDPISKRFGRLKVSMGFGREKVFHSIRKTTATLLEQQGVAPLTIMSILGHTRKSVTFDIYAKGPTVSQMKSELDKLQFKI